ncbi:MAG: arylesterase [Gammaproteobacteria bacterium]|nr:arylesterase [Gammaproteobacteria bacterium]NND55184.1 arylesterase [Gammaproteobacteria bacterium]
MQKLLLLLLSLLFVAAAPADDRPTLLVVGDSLSAGYGMDSGQSWVAMLQARLEAEGYGYRVVNASISGDTSSGGLSRITRQLSLHQPEIVIIELGGNDGLRGLPVETLYSNLDGMITQAQDSGAAVVLAGMLIPPNYGVDYADEFAAVYPKLAEKYDLALIPFFMDGVALDYSLFQQDGIHPTVAAQSILLKNVWDVLGDMLSAKHAEQLVKQ